MDLELRLQACFHIDLKMARRYTIAGPAQSLPVGPRIHYELHSSNTYQEALASFSYFKEQQIICLTQKALSSTPSISCLAPASSVAF